MHPGKRGNPGNDLELICPGIYYFKSFVLEMPWNYFIQFTNFFSQSLFVYFAFSNLVLYFSKFEYFDHMPCYY